MKNTKQHNNQPTKNEQFEEGSDLVKNISESKNEINGKKRLRIGLKKKIQ